MFSSLLAGGAKQLTPEQAQTISPRDMFASVWWIVVGMIAGRRKIVGGAGRGFLMIGIAGAIVGRWIMLASGSAAGA
jgi:hypothetical protein